MADRGIAGRTGGTGIASAVMKRASLWRRARTLLAVGGARQRLVAEAAFALLVARIALLVVPFPRLAARWGVLLPVGDPGLTPPEALDAAAVETAQAIGWAVTATASVMPFKAVCMQQAVAARAMLARRGVASVLHYGAGRDDKGALVAHAWLDAAGVKVTGYPIAAGIAEIGAFVPQP
ncbi:lasso peptide biosynthesis B2 protein [Sphingomonas sp. CCH10-B3]|uniref:lasso peptide biosynthesis B2 protein n=2 Tax=Sphingomonas TaxID=13687 RepID=UPI00082CF98E|nr:lasso peptide biosynthesis B2 protein [Sphingomonas sp. CCH10-B3]MBA3878815.1 hypothetical protein [Sphingobium sp.]